MPSSKHQDKLSFGPDDGINWTSPTVEGPGELPLYTYGEFGGPGYTDGKYQDPNTSNPSGAYEDRPPCRPPGCVVQAARHRLRPRPNTSWCGSLSGSGRGRPHSASRDLARATTYRHLAPSRPEPPRRPGPVGPMPDAALVDAIRAVLTASPSTARATGSLGPAARGGRSRVQAPGAAAHAREQPACALSGPRAPGSAQPRRHHHPRDGGHDVGHRPDHDHHR